MTAFLIRNWQGVIGIAISLSLIVLVAFRTAERNDARAERDEARSQVASLEAHIVAQNAGIEQLRVERAAAQQRATQALQQAQAANARQQPVIERLRESAGRAPVPGDACEVSETLRQVEGL